MACQPQLGYDARLREMLRRAALLAARAKAGGGCREPARPFKISPRQQCGAFSAFTRVINARCRSANPALIVWSPRQDTNPHGPEVEARRSVR
jgi:hypothetical protein